MAEENSEYFFASTISDDNIVSSKNLRGYGKCVSCEPIMDSQVKSIMNNLIMKQKYIAVISVPIMQRKKITLRHTFKQNMNILDFV